MSTADDRVAIVIVSWQSEALLFASTASAYRQKREHDRVILWDNGSDQATQRVLDQLANDYPDLIIKRATDNLGFAAANNEASRLTPELPFILTHNPDIKLADNCLQIMLSTMDRQANCGAVGVTQLNGDGSRVDGLGDAYTLAGRAYRRGHKMALTDEHIQLLAMTSEQRLAVSSEQEVFCTCAAATLYRRQAFDAVGGFDSNFFCYFEDVDLGYRLRLAGYRNWQAAGALAWHQGTPSAGHGSDTAVFCGHRNMVWTFIKNTPAILFVPLLVLHVAANAVALVQYGFRGRFGVVFRAKSDALRDIRRVWRQRRAIQATRQASAIKIWSIMTKRL